MSTNPHEIVVSFTDIETTGLEQEKGHRIIEIAFSAWRYDQRDPKVRRKIGSTWVQRIDPKRPIDPGAEAVHGISLVDLKGQPVWEDVAPRVHKLLSMSKLVVAHNGEGFDCPFLALELVRVGLTIPKFHVFDTMLRGRAATPFGKVPNLGELCWSMGIDYDPSAAHSAAYDVEVMESAFWMGVERGLFELPEFAV